MHAYLSLENVQRLAPKSAKIVYPSAIDKAFEPDLIDDEQHPHELARLDEGFGLVNIC